MSNPKLFLGLLLIFSVSCNSGTGVSSTDETTTAKAISVEGTRVSVNKTATQAESHTRATNTQVAGETATQAAGETATVAAPMAALAEQLAADGYLSNAAGSYMRIPNFDESYAATFEEYIQYDLVTEEGSLVYNPDIRAYEYVLTVESSYTWVYNYAAGIDGFFPRDFLLRVDVSWENEVFADQNHAGCGFLIWDGIDKNYLVWLSGSGVARVIPSSLFYLADDFEDLESDQLEALVMEYEDISLLTYNEAELNGVEFPAGTAELMLMVEDEMLSFFVNGQLALTENIVTAHPFVQFAIIPGASDGFGTRCIMENTEVWVLEDGDG